MDVFACRYGMDTWNVYPAPKQMWELYLQPDEKKPAQLLTFWKGSHPE